MEAKLGKNIIVTAQKVLSAESEAIQSLISTIGVDFISTIEAILNSEGKVVITGIGKSAIIGQKIVATLNSTGQVAVFLHAAEALHGDLGILQKKDIVICISKSGDTPEIRALVPLLKRHSEKTIAIVCNEKSYLGLNSDLCLHIPIKREACPLNLAPTTSTTATLAMGDALAMALLEARSFSKTDFAALHPGGSLGKRLYLKVSDIYPNNPKPHVTTDTNIKEVIMEISSNRLGITAVLDSKEELVGVITDGDLRRMLFANENFQHLKAKDIMTSNPKTIESDVFAVEALSFMEKNSITQLVVKQGKKVLGFVHLHDLLKEGLV
ncbi:arabinose-5-phosphate isomerase [Spirosomataceae bacterium TFI 002]|nr:arabinose-5-phosphate isomerase [Spirosomataceae bacterium TFI 002]